MNIFLISPVQISTLRRGQMYTDNNNNNNNGGGGAPQEYIPQEFSKVFVLWAFCREFLPRVSSQGNS